MKSNKTVTDSANISEKWFRGVPQEDEAHLLNSLRSLERLQPPTPSFPLYGRRDWAVVERFLSSKEVAATQPPSWLLEYEKSRKDKFGPQGGHAPWCEMRENAEMYFTRPTKDRLPVPPEVLAKYERLSLLMASVQDTLEQLKDAGKVQERANGWRLFSLKKTDEAAQRDAVHLIRTGEWREGWAYFFARFNKQKKRLFVPMPFSANIRQGQWFNGFLAAIQNDLRQHGQGSDFAFWGDKIGFVPLFLNMMTSALSGYDPSHLVYVMRDFDKMDTTVGEEQKSQSFVPKIAAAYHYGRDSKAYAEMSEAMLFSNRCPIATPDGMWCGSHGEGSGATVTNGGETCCNEDYDYWLQWKLKSLISDRIQYKLLCSYGNGDDGISVYYLTDVSQFEEFSSFVRKAAEWAARRGGYVIQSTKWDIHLGTYGKYCQYLPTWDNNLNRVRMRYPAALILNSVLNPEKQYSKSDWDKDYRDLEIIEKLNNGFDLEYFEPLIDYVDNGMKYRLLGRSETETSRILSKWDKYRSLQSGSREFQLLDSNWEADISSSPVVQYLLKKRRS